MHKRKSYTVYPPDYLPGDKFFKVLTVKDAKKRCHQLGIGSTVMPCHTVHPARCMPAIEWSSGVLWTWG